MASLPVHPGAVEHYASARDYDARYAQRVEDVSYYVRRAKAAQASGAPRASGARVLEYGAGTGRVTLPLARAGHRVTAVDLSGPLLEALRDKLSGEPAQVRRHVRVEQADMRSLRLRQRYDLVLAPFNTFQHLYSRADVDAFLANVRAHLVPGGRFLFDVYRPRPEELVSDPERGLDYDVIGQVLTQTMDGPEGAALLAHRQFFPRELEMLLHYAGFTRLRMTADFTGRRPDADTQSLVVHCQRPSREGAAR